MEASYVGGFDDFGECNEFGQILSNCRMNADKGLCNNYQEGGGQ